MKVALCMRGAVAKKGGSFFHKNDIYKDSEYVDYNACYNSIKKHILDSNSEYSIDIFCQGWNLDLEDDLVKKYNPKKYCFENNAKYNEDILKLCNQESDFAGISQSLAIKKVIELKEEYEKENNITYDIVILYRYDVFLWKDMNLKEYADLNHTIYVNAHTDGNGDFHFVMNNDQSNNMKGLMNSITLGNQHKAHYWIKNYIVNYMKTNLKLDNIRPGIDQEVMRKMFVYCHINIELFNSYR